MSREPKRYRAFISYSQMDAPVARRLHRALETYRLPIGADAPDMDPTTRRLGRFFRDDEEMGAATDLGLALEGAIADSESLIVLCSPHAAQSKWVNEEVLHFKRTGRGENIFAVIVGGLPNASASVDPQERAKECFPPALRFALEASGVLSAEPSEPLGLDLRKEDFSRIRARLAAGLLKIPFDTLWRRDARRIAARRLGDFYVYALIGLALLSVAVPIVAPRLEAAIANQSPTAANFPAGTRYEDLLANLIPWTSAETLGVLAVIASMLFLIIRRIRVVGDEA